MCTCLGARDFDQRSTRIAEAPPRRAPVVLALAVHQPTHRAAWIRAPLNRPQPTNPQPHRWTGPTRRPPARQPASFPRSKGTPPARAATAPGSPPSCGPSCSTGAASAARSGWPACGGPGRSRCVAVLWMVKSNRSEAPVSIDRPTCSTLGPAPRPPGSPGGGRSWGRPRCAVPTNGRPLLPHLPGHPAGGERRRGGGGGRG